MPGEFPNLLLVTVDCLRRDRLSAYGYPRATTPFLDGLLPDALHATSAHAAAPWTAPSVVSLLTGLMPHRHGAGIIPGDPKELTRRNLPTTLAPEVPILPDLLEGYASAAFTAVWNAALPLEGRFGHSVLVDAPAPKVMAEAATWIGAQTEPWFCWVHLGDAHDPLEVPRPLRELFGPVRYRTARRWASTRADEDLSTERFGSYREERIRLYDAAVRAADSAVEDLWAAIDAGVRSRTLLVVTSDHGEELWEHRETERDDFFDPRGLAGVGHGHNLFQVHLLVPLIVLGPDIAPGAVTDNVSLTDVAPTLADRLGLASSGFDGFPLTRPLPAQRPVAAQAIAYGHEKSTVVVGDHKLLSSPGDGYERAFALGNDRVETDIPVGTDVADRLRPLLPAEPPTDGSPVTATDEIAGHLRDLGYLE